MSARSHPDHEAHPSAAHKPVRSAVRFPLELPVTLVTGTEAIPARTVDVSSTGVLFVTDKVLETGTLLEWTMLLPSGAMGSDKDILVQCAGRVVWSQNFSPIRVAVVIDEYRIKEETGD